MSKVELDGELVRAIKYALIAYNFELCRPPRKSEINFEVEHFKAFMEAWGARRDRKLQVVRNCLAKLNEIAGDENEEAAKAFE